MRKVGDLVDINCATLQAGAAVNVQLETALDVPLYLLAEPALNEAGTHFKTYDFVLELHQVVKHRNVAWFVDPVEQVCLHDLTRIVPLLRLPDQLASLQAVVHHIVCRFAVVPIN